MFPITEKETRTSIEALMQAWPIGACHDMHPCHAFFCSCFKNLAQLSPHVTDKGQCHTFLSMISGECHVDMLLYNTFMVSYYSPINALTGRTSETGWISPFPSCRATKESAFLLLIGCGGTQQKYRLECHSKPDHRSAN